jgi:hypothetical protein
MKPVIKATLTLLGIAFFMGGCTAIEYYIPNFVAYVLGIILISIMWYALYVHFKVKEEDRELREKHNIK